VTDLETSTSLPYISAVAKCVPPAPPPPPPPPPPPLRRFYECVESEGTTRNGGTYLFVTGGSLGGVSYMK